MDDSNAFLFDVSVIHLNFDAQIVRKLMFDKLNGLNEDVM